MKWFTNPKTLEALKKQYKELVFKHHPDVGGSDEEMKEINNEYDFLFERLKNIHENAEGQAYTAKDESTEMPNDFKTIILNLINLAGINIEICGSWIWVTGDTYQHRETLKSMKFRFSKSKTAWYFHDEGYRKTNKRSFTLEEIRDLYGSEIVKTEPRLKLAIV